LATNVYLPSSVANLDPSMSRDGRFIAYSLSSQLLRVRDMLNNTDVYTSSAAVSSAALSPGGTRLLYRFGNLLAAADLTGNSNTVSFFSTFPIQSQAQWSTNDRFFAFVTSSNTIPGGPPADANATN